MLPRSLALFNDLFYYWTGEHGIVERDEVQKLRDRMLNLARHRFLKRPPLVLLAVLSSRHPGALRNFVSPPDRHGRITQTKPGDWNWLLPVIFQSLHENPNLMLPQVARLVSNPKDFYLHDEMEMTKVMQRGWIIDRDLTLLIFGDETLALIRIIAHAPFEAINDPDPNRLIAVRALGAGLARRIRSDWHAAGLAWRMRHFPLQCNFTSRLAGSRRLFGAVTVYTRSGAASPSRRHSRLRIYRLENGHRFH